MCTIQSLPFHFVVEIMLANFWISDSIHLWISVSSFHLFVLKFLLLFYAVSVYISFLSPFSHFLFYFGGFWMNFEEIPFLLLCYKSLLESLKSISSDLSVPSMEIFNPLSLHCPRVAIDVSPWNTEDKDVSKLEVSASVAAKAVWQNLNETSAACLASFGNSNLHMIAPQTVLSPSRGTASAEWVCLLDRALWSSGQGLGKHIRGFISLDIVCAGLFKV